MYFILVSISLLLLGGLLSFMLDRRYRLCQTLGVAGAVLGAAAAACGCLGLVKVLTPWISLLCTSLVRWDGEALGFFLARYWPGFLPVPGLVLLACGGWMLLRRRRAGLLTIGAIFQAAYAVAYPLIDEWWLNGLPFEPYEIQLLVGLAGPVACVAVLLSDRFCEQLEAWRKTPPIAKDVA